MARNKGVFNEQLGDIDEMLPSIPKPDQLNTNTTAATKSGTRDWSASEDQSGVKGRAETSAATGSKQQQPAVSQVAQVYSVGETRSRTRATTSVPTAEVAPPIHRALSNMINKEKVKDPITARTFAQVVLDAIEASQDKLETFWKVPVPASASGGGLFSRTPATPARRRRHPEPPARVPLTGISPANAELLDDLVEQWGAPSRSALVEQALRFYEPLQPRKRAPKQGKSVPSSPSSSKKSTRSSGKADRNDDEVSATSA
jgi:hypothetical protein